MQGRQFEARVPSDVPKDKWDWPP